MLLRSLFYSIHPHNTAKMELSKHSKLAILLAPFLIVGGYIASDYYVANKTNEQRLFKLSMSDLCDIFKEGCVLTSGNMQVNITDNLGITKANTSFPVDSVVISLVYNKGNETLYRLDQALNPQYWERETDIKKSVTEGLAHTIRVLIKDKGNIYLSEFSVTQTGPNLE